MAEVAYPIAAASSSAQMPQVAALRPLCCRACLQRVTPVQGTRTVMQHQAGLLGQFALFECILCCPKCGERDL